jgi:hypothetical protein
MLICDIRANNKPLSVQWVESNLSTSDITLHTGEIELGTIEAGAVLLLKLVDSPFIRFPEFSAEVSGTTISFPVGECTVSYQKGSGAAKHWPIQVSLYPATEIAISTDAR